MASCCLAASFVILAGNICVLDMDLKWAGYSAWGAGLPATMVPSNKALKVPIVVIRRAACGQFRLDLVVARRSPNQGRWLCHQRFRLLNVECRRFLSYRVLIA